MGRLAATALLLSCGVALADPVADGLAYLLSQRAPDGSFGGGTNEQKVLATVEALETLRALGQGDTLVAHGAELYLAISPRAPDAEVELRRERALAPTGQAIPLSRRTAHGAGFEHADPLHLALTLQSDVAAGRAAGNETFLALLDLKARLQPSGCWRWADNDDSFELTAQAVRSVRALLDVPTPGLPSNGHLNFALQEGARCLRATNGSYGSLGATAMALEALLVAPGSNALAIQNARATLLLAQGSDGSFGGSVRVTAIAVRGLLGGAPDWRVTPDDFNRPVLAFVDPGPLAGVDAVARLDVENRSGAPAPATTVRFFLKPAGGGAELVGPDVAVPALAAGQQVALSALIPTSALQGQYLVRAVVDPSNLVAEISEHNNEASAPLNVRAEADLAITSSSIRFVAAGAGQTSVQVEVRNLGVPLGQAVSVGVWKGSPGSGGVRIGGATLPAGLATNGVATVSVLWSSASANGPTVVTAVVDENQVLSEADEANNSAFRYYFPGSANPVDLSVVFADVSLLPAAPHAGDVLTVSAAVRNLSAFDASRVAVSLTTATGALLAATELPFVAANGSAVVSLPFVVASSLGVQVRVDPQAQLNDTNRANNIVGVQVTVLQAPELELSLTTLNDGTPVGSAVQGTVTNQGTSPADTSVTLTDVTHGTALGVVPVALRPGGGSTAFSFGIPPGLGAIVVRACVDAEDAFAEPNELDNCRTLSLSGTALIDLKVHPRDLAFSPVGADVGEKVHLGALVRSLRVQAQGFAATGTVEWWQGLPDKKGSTLLGTRALAVPSESSATVGLDWVRAEGPVEVCARVVQVLPRDSDLTNNVACRHLFLEEIVDLGVGDYRIAREPEVRVGRVSGSVKPELAVGYSIAQGPAGAPVTEAGVALLQPTPSGHALVWRRAGLDTLGDVALADLDGDGSAEVLLMTTRNQAPFTVQIDALRPDGTLKWQASYVGQTQLASNNSAHLSVGDVDGDGVGDVVQQQDYLHVFSGVDGHQLFQTLVAPANTGPDSTVVLDVDGDGANEVLGCSSAGAYLVNRFGAIVWQSAGFAVNGGTFSVVDLDLDGFPEQVFPNSFQLVAFDARTGVRKTLPGTSIRSAEFAVPGVGALRQDGLPYLALGDNGTDSTVAYGPDASLLWLRQLVGQHGALGSAYTTTLADLRGLGRPQVIANSNSVPFTLQDGRNGAPLLAVPAGPLSSSQVFFADRHPVVADIAGDGRAQVAVGATGSSLDSWSSDGAPLYGQGVLVFSSAHWKKQPTVWATRVLRKGQLGDDLKLGTDYRWWTGHNTWNQQFDVEPAKLLPDVTVSLVAASPAPGTAGATSTLTATVKNVGGLNVSNVAVAFYDGDPQAGGRLLGTATAVGPLAVRGGTGTASIPWLAWPEGEHTLFAVANPGKAIEEPDYENNRGQARTFVQPGTNLCDAVVDPASLAALPAAPLAGQAVQLSATVRNLGPVACPAHLLTVRDGAGGDVLGLAAVPALAPAASAGVSLSTTASPGTHLLRFIADEGRALQEGNTDNNTATLALNVPAATQPDYLVTAFSFSPNPARAGEQVTATAVVKNQGATATVLAVLGTNVGAAATIDALAAGQSATVTFGFVAPAASTSVEARADADGAVLEFDETNNLFAAPLTIEATALSLSGAAVPPSVLPGAAVSFDVSAQVSGGNALEVFFDAELRTASGAAVATVATGRREVLAPGATALGFPFNAGSLAAGTYVLHLTGFNAGRLAAFVDLALTVQPETAALTALAADRGSYRPGAQAVLTQRTTNLSRNAALAGASLTVRVLSPSAAVLFSTTRQLATLVTGGFVDTVDLFAISPSLAPGTYAVDSTVRDSGGLVLATTAATFSVVYQPQDTVRGTLSAVNPFPIGPALNASIVLTNDGALPLSNGSLELSLLNATSLAVESFGSSSVSLAPGASTTVSVPLATSGIPEGQKLLVARLGARTLGRLLLLAIRNTDVDPPVILVSGVADGEAANHDVTPVVTVQDQSAVTTTFLLDGLPFSSGSVVTAEGPHLLSLAATDASGNSAQLVIHFTLDRVAPVLTLNGPADGALLVGPVALSFSANEGTVSATLDAASFPSGGTVGADGPHVWTVTAVDAAGNSTTETRTFTLDATPPVISVVGVADGDLLNHGVTIAFSAADAHPGAVAATLDGAPFISGTAVSAEGTHVLLVTAVDALGNTSARTVTFAVDLTAPVISVTGITAGAVRNTPATIGYSAAGEATVSASLDGVPFASGDTVGTAGDHLLVVSATDPAGNTATLSVPFALDFAAPVISITGVTSGQLRNTPATISFSAADAHAGSTTATLDGAPFSSGGTVGTEGDHLLVVTSTDAAGNTAAASVPFSLDLTPPVIAIAGVTAGSVRNTPAAISFSATDAHPGTVGATLDGAAFTSGSTVSAPGSHLLVVTATDAAGNTATRSVAFEIDTAAPVITVTGITAGALRNIPATISFSAADAHPGTVTATLDGAAFSSGGVVSGEGDHLLVVSATDAAGNAATVSVPFSLDFTAPVLTVSGVTEGASGAGFTPVFSATDVHAVTVAATLDGAAFASGTTVSRAGAHTLVVTATDGAGNVATQTVHFTVTGGTAGLPTFHFAVCAFGALSVSNNATVSGAGGAEASVAAHGAFSLQNNARIGGGVVAGGNATLKNNALVDGRVFHGGTFSQQSNALAVGGHQLVTPAPQPCECGFDLSAALADAAATNDNALLAGNPGFSNGVLTVQNNATVTLAAGRYYLAALELKNNARLKSAPGAQVRLYVQGGVKTGNNSTLGAPVGSPMMLLLSGASGTGAVTVNNNADAMLQLYAPNATVTLANNAKLYGAVVGRNVTLDNNQRVELTGFTQASPPPLTCQ